MQKETNQYQDTLAPLKPIKVMQLTSATQLCLIVLWHPDLTFVGSHHNCIFSHDGNLSINRFTPTFESLNDNNPRPLASPRISRTPIRIESLGKDKFRITPPHSAMEVKINGAYSSEPQIAHLKDKDDLICITISDAIILGLCHLPKQQFINISNSLLGMSIAINATRNLISKYAATDLPIMLIGETGTGKELAAHDIHNNSDRSSKPLISTNMATLPTELATAELFGSQKGAFTGSSQDRKGLFGEAEGGTLFCDEIGDTPHSVQPMLLRAVETCYIRPLGQDADVKTDIRIITATDRRIDESTSDRSFNTPLYHRLSATQIIMPTLRNRLVDIPILLVHFLLENPLWHEKNLKINSSLLFELIQYNWPGNVRELKNVANQILLGENPKLIKNKEVEPNSNSRKAKTIYRSHHSITEAELIKALDQNEWLIKPTASSLSISRTSCYELIKNCYIIRQPEDIPKKEIQEALDEYSQNINALSAKLRIPQGMLKNYLIHEGFL